MNAGEIKVEAFVSMFKSMKGRERGTVLARLLSEKHISEEMADSIALELRRSQPSKEFRKVFTKLGIQT